MPKRINNIYYNALTFSKIKAAYDRTRRRKKLTEQTLKFEIYLEDYIYDIYTKLKNKTYNVSKGIGFIVKEPKEREIWCLPFYDRVIQQLYVYEYIMPYMVPKFISTSYACIPKRGLHQCINMLQHYMQCAKRNYKNPYVLQYDVSKFFNTIDKEILYKIMCKYYKDKDFLELTRKYIWINNDQKGIFIGNYTSQYFANIYMNELDHYIKEELKIKYYIRFMDDGILIVEGKQKAKEALEKIEAFLKENLELSLNKKTRYYPLNQGIVYCGFKIFCTHKLIKKQNKINVKRRIKSWKKIPKTKDTRKAIKQSFNAWKGYAKHANSYNLIKKLEENYKKSVYF